MRESCTCWYKVKYIIIIITRKRRIVAIVVLYKCAHSVQINMTDLNPGSETGDKDAMEWEKINLEYLGSHDQEVNGGDLTHQDPQVQSTLL